MIWGNKRIKELENQLESLKQENKRLKELLEKHTSISPVSPVSIVGIEEKIIQVSEDNRIVYANSGFLGIINIPRETLLGMELKHIDHFPWGRGILSKVVDNVRKETRRIEQEVRYFDTKLQHEIFLRITGIPVSNRLIQIIIEDITRIKKLE